MMSRILGLLFLVLILGCDRPAAKDAAHLTPVRIGYRPNVVVDLGVLRAIEAGDFRRSGLDVQLQPFGRADLLLAALDAGTIDGSLGVPLEPVLGRATQGEYPYKAILVWYFDDTNPYDGLVVQSSSQIQSLADLRGRTVGAHPSKQVQYFVQQLAPGAQVRQYNPATPLLGLSSGDQDAVYVLEPTLSEARANGQYRVLETGAISRSLFGGARVPAAITVLSTNWIRTHPTAAKQFTDIARTAQSRFRRDRDSTYVMALLARREFGGFSAPVARTVVEPVVSLPEELGQREFETFATRLRSGGLLSGPVMMDSLFLIPDDN